MDRVSRSSSPNRVLIVDDDPGIRLMLRTSFATVGHEVIESASGMQALGWLTVSPRVVVATAPQVVEPSPH